MCWICGYGGGTLLKQKGPVSNIEIPEVQSNSRGAKIRRLRELVGKLASGEVRCRKDEWYFKAVLLLPQHPSCQRNPGASEELTVCLREQRSYLLPGRCRQSHTGRSGDLGCSSSVLGVISVKSSV